MSIDVTQFLQTFVEESMEMLQEAEDILLTVSHNNIDKEKINQLFRVMHSIKGSSAIFDFDVINKLTHRIESFLENVREDRDQLTQNDIDLLLSAVDRIRALVRAIDENTEMDAEGANELGKMVEQRIIAGVTDIAAAAKAPDQTLAKNDSFVGWDINFKPPLTLFQDRGEPFRLFQTLAELGKIEVEIITKDLPQFPDFDPMECFLSWHIILYATIDESELIELFSWITELKYVHFTKLKVSAKVEMPPSKKKELEAQPQTTTNVRVSTKKIDDLINLIGELVITQSMLTQLIDNFNIANMSKLKEVLEILSTNSRDLQSSIMRIRMVPLELVFNRFVRLVRDQSTALGKQVELVMSGEQTEIDKNMIEKISDPLVHLIRNALDHGIETPEIRLQNNKPAVAMISLAAYQDGNSIVIDIADDGAGLNKGKIRSKAIAHGLMQENQHLSDQELYQFIFHAGFSTRDVISDISGRGVGLDVVYKNIHDLGGEIEIETEEGQGTIFHLRLPLTLTIMDCQLLRIGEQTYTIPLNNVTEIISLDGTEFNHIDTQTNLFHFRDEYIPLIDLAAFFNLPPNQENTPSKKCLIVIEVGNLVAGFLIDALLTQQQVVIKNLEENYRKLTGISGVTILGDGQVALILDAKSIIECYMDPVHYQEKSKIASSLPSEKIASEYRNSEFMQFLSFTLGTQEYGIDILCVKEIKIWENANQLPRSPDYIKGVINLRGNVIPILDLHEQFGVSHYNYGHKEIVIILIHQTHQFGLIADHITDTYTIRTKEIKPLQAVNDSISKKYIAGLATIDRKMIPLLNIKQLTATVLDKEVIS